MINLRKTPYGYIDHYSNGLLYGWAWNPANHNQRIRLDVFWQDKFVGQFTADIFREDLSSKGDGRHAFRAHIPERFGYDADLSSFEAYISFPKQVALRRAGARRAIDRFGRQAWTERIRVMFEPLLSFLNSSITDENLADPSNQKAEESHLFERLFEQSPVPSPPPLRGMTLSAYTDYIRHRSKRDYLFDISFARSEYDSFLKTYIEEYGASHGDQRAPLSKTEINYLAEMLRPDGKNIEVPRIATFFLAPNEKLSNDDFIYWWSVEKARECFVDDCLIPDSYISRLRSTSGDLQDYPLSIFMRMFIIRNFVFKGIRHGGARGRAVIYFVILLYALRMPHLISFFPTKWLTKIFYDRDGATLFDEISSMIFGRPDLLTAARYARHMLQKGYDVSTQKFLNFSERGHRIFAAARRASRHMQYDVQIIGPFGRTFGLGESCRLLGRSIEALGYKTNLVDFDVGALSPFEAEEYGRVVARAGVNILHINAETIPAAIAYLPDVFTEAHNVGFVYWELNFPSNCQKLGLELMDEIWAPSSFIETNLGSHCRTIINVGMACATLRQENEHSRRRALCRYSIQDDEFVFLHTSDAFSRVQRKNPIGVIRAFLAAFAQNERVKLIVKTHNAGASSAIGEQQSRIWRSIREVAASDRRIVFIDETFSNEEHQMLVASANCVVSLHRAEGFGLDMLYAMGCGVPVLATGYSGNLEFCTDETSWLVGFHAVPVLPEEYPFVEPGHTWAEPNHDEAVAKMREIVRNASKRNELARNGQKFVAARFSLGALSERVGGRLNQLLGGGADKESEKRVRTESCVRVPELGRRFRS
jgi:glycosyltransferase involved in cell wall biosynthesis